MFEQLSTLIPKRSIYYRLEHSVVFPDEQNATVNSYLNGIGRENIIKAGTYFVGYHKKAPLVLDNVQVLSNWFGPENYQFANEVYSKIRQIEYKEKKPTFILNIYTTLKLIEQAFHLTEDNTLSPMEIERRLFKAYLLLNELDNNKDNTLSASLKNVDPAFRWPMMVLTQTFRYSDISNYSMREVFDEQLVKAIQFFSFLENEYPNELQFFNSYYDCASWREYLKRTFPLLKILKYRNIGFTEITVGEGPTKDSDESFINKFAFGDETEELKDLDFVSLRSKPLIKTTENRYRVVYDLFLLEKVFNGIYFTLRQMPGLSLDRLKSIFTFQFSEKTLLYYILRYIYDYDIKQFSGEELDKIGVNAPPDYYIRKRTKVLLVESKDIVLNASIKESADYNAYVNEIQKKLYYDTKKGQIKPKAILQLIRNVSEILSGNVDYDRIRKGSKIYPIIIVHHRQLNVAGLSQLLNVWFQGELKKLKEQGLDTRRVAPVTVINIATLILYADKFKQKEFFLERMIDRFHRSSQLRQLDAADWAEVESELLRRIHPFNIFIARHIKRERRNNLLQKNLRHLGLRRS